MPSNSQAPFTMGRTGSRCLFEQNPEAAGLASSLHTVPTPPRVASRSQRVDGAAAISSSTSGDRQAVSE